MEREQWGIEIISLVVLSRPSPSMSMCRSRYMCCLITVTMVIPK
jgi:hypothetical protein